MNSCVKHREPHTTSFVEHGSAFDLLRLRWLEGRIFAGLSDFARAEAAFQETRAGFADRGQVYTAALAGLDLAALWARQERFNEIPTLAQEIITHPNGLTLAGYAADERALAQMRR